MSGEPTTPQEIQELLDTIRAAAAGLNERQKALLEAMITMAAQVTGTEIPGDPPAFAPEFRVAFTPEKADLILGFDAEVSQDSAGESGSRKRSHVADYVTRTVHP